MAREYKVPAHLVPGILKQCEELGEKMGETWVKTPLGVLHSLLVQGGANTEKSGPAKDAVANRKSLKRRFTTR